MEVILEVNKFAWCNFIILVVFEYVTCGAVAVYAVIGMYQMLSDYTHADSLGYTDLSRVQKSLGAALRVAPVVL